MRFSKATDYGLLLLIDLAKLSAGCYTNVKQVAQEHKISERFLANIVRQLACAGIVDSRRGTKGGIRLAKPSNEISLVEVIQALEGPIELFDCQRIPSLCKHEDLCTLKTFWTGVQDQLVASLSGAKIGDFAHIQWVSGPT